MIMHPEQPSLEELNAYVDGELSADRAANVARYIAQDPTMARQAAALTRLRSVLPQAVEVPPLEMPAQSKRYRSQMMKLAAACVAAMLSASGVTVLYLNESSVSSPWLEAAVSAHDAWQLPSTDNGAVPGGIPREAVDHDTHSAAAFIPDLSATKLSVVFMDTTRKVLGNSATVIGYAGTRGCKVTLVASAGSSQETGDFRFLPMGESSAYAWRTGQLDYLLIANGMDRQRFDLIAKSVFRATEDHSPFDEATRSALLDSRQKSKPCMA